MSRVTRRRIHLLSLCTVAAIVLAAAACDAASPVKSTPGTNGCLVGKRPAASICRILRNDTGHVRNPSGLWGKVDCVKRSRQQRVLGGGDRLPRADGRRQGNRSYRRMTVYDGDNVWGERCELARNEHRHGGKGGPGTFNLYREGETRITQMSIRLPRSYPLNSSKWQVISQMKQTQPANNGSGTSAISLSARRGRWELTQSRSVLNSAHARILWAAPARKRTWTRISLVVTYSQYPSQGSIRIFADRNGDGDVRDRRERSRVFHTYTLKRETPGGKADGIDPGESIPSHLRVGIYHDPSVHCPKPRGCSVDIDNVQVAAP